MFASSGGCSEFLQRTNVNVGKYGGHCSGHCSGLGALWNTSFHKVVLGLNSGATFKRTIVGGRVSYTVDGTRIRMRYTQRENFDE